MNNISLLIKPASSLCNMRCKYCFYANVSDNRSVKSMGIMSYETSHNLIKAVFDNISDKGAVSFAFQGGEPTLAGLDFFKDFVAYTNANKKPYVTISYSLQTNAMLIDEAFAHFFKENNFLIGVSIDGDKYLHDYHRLNEKQQGTYETVSKAFKLLRSYKVDVNALCVVTNKCAKNAGKVYASLKKIGFDYIQYIPCLDPLEKSRGGEAFSLTPKMYGDFLCKTFDVWFKDWQEGNYKSVRIFDDYVHMAMGLPPSTCATSGSCGAYLVVEGDGSLYPCDFYVLDQWHLGNINTNDIKDVIENKKHLEFLSGGDNKPPECESCPYKKLCNGGCKRDWVYSENKTEAHNYFCEAFKQFFDYSGERIKYIAAKETAARKGF